MKDIAQNIKLWLRIIRPQTLFASLVPVLVALLVTYKLNIPGYTFQPLVASATVACALTLQILSNLINDYYDYLRGTDKAGRVGYKRALAEGEVNEKQMYNACLSAAILACASGLLLVLTGGWVILTIGLSALLFAWLYTATSHSLSYLGIADIFVFLYYGVIASTGTAYLQLAAIYGIDAPGYGSILMTWDELIPLLLPSFFAGGVSGLISMGVLMINNLRDLQSDRAVGKHTLPVRFGKRTGDMLMFIYSLLMAMLAFLAFGGMNHSGMLPLPCYIAIFAIGLQGKVANAEGAQYNKCLLMQGLLNVLYLLLCVLFFAL